MSVLDERLDAGSDEANEEQDAALTVSPDGQLALDDAATQEPLSRTLSLPVATTPTPARPTLLEVFTGQAIDIVDKLFQAQKATDQFVTALRKAQDQTTELQAVPEQLEQVKHIKRSIDAALMAYQWTPGKIWLYQWSLLALLLLCGLAEAVFIEFYCRWHGASFISLDLYAPVNIDILSTMDFVNGMSTMSIAAEVLMWSSLGVWAQQSYANTMAMLRREFRFADHGLRYIGVLMRNTSVAAIIIILLRLSKFSMFGVSLEASNPLAFDITIGLSFLLGFFGDDAYDIMAGFKDRLVKGVSQDNAEGPTSDQR